ncbi:hypothetical protein BC792_13214 [Sphingobacterium allocomposti]|uniref:Uncharacterized protein n=1 Tax=Sphingobacterium allocomposti TaxID=415956 RepID=A0A5S5CYV5_9SPHI|nr:hypothetical protein BC792_13214 [Sphingobacterium composti Yoo et al. 2007 non Ten et al. 2007]
MPATGLSITIATQYATELTSYFNLHPKIKDNF